MVTTLDMNKPALVFTEYFIDIENVNSCDY